MIEEVVKDLEGTKPGVYPSWAEVVPWVVRVLGASVKKFQDHWQAEAFVENHKKQKEAETTVEENLDWWYAVVRGRNGLANVNPSWAKASVQVVGVSGSVVKKFQEFEEAMNFINQYQRQSSHFGEVSMAPHRLLAPEPSRKELPTTKGRR
jgi:viroplasmin and RNaseH domain-containing protein